MPEPATAGFQLSPQQKHVWSWQEGQPGVAQVAVLLEGTLAIPRLKQALRALANRHEILRTSFHRNAGMKFPFQVVSTASDFNWSEVGPSASEPEQQLIDRLFAARTDVDFNRLPLYCDLASLASNRHILILSLPVLCADAVSLNNIVLDLRNEYAGDSQSAVEPLQYADYSEWQNNFLQKNDGEATAGQSYWNQQNLASIPALPLPFQAKSSNTAYHPETVPVPLSKHVLRKLEEVSSGDPASFLLTAWKLLASRLTGQDEIVVAEVSDGRHHEELTSALGLLSKALPSYGNFESDLTFADAVIETEGLRNEAIEFQDYLEPSGRDLPVGFSIETRTVPSPTGDLHFSICDLRSDTNPFHLQLRCIALPESWNLALIYDSAYFRYAVVERFAQQFSLLLSAAVDNPNAAVSALASMQQNERQQILAVFNQTGADFPSEKSIHQLFEEQAERTPDRPALRFGETELSYAQLNTHANQLAHLLRRHGIKANVAVGLCTERSAEMLVGLLGILKAGGFYVPLVPDNPKSRLGHQLQETAAPIVITQAALLDRLPEFSGKIICLDRDKSSLNSEPATNPGRNNSPADLVYAIYTSGSTGTPKGVAVRHSNLVNYSSFVRSLLNLEKYSDGLQFATVSTISADLGNTCIFPALISGGCLHVVGQETAMAANLFANYTGSHPIDVLKITPSHLATLLSAPEGNAVLPQKFLILGGEASSWDLVQRIRQASNCTVINHYGPTEATVGCCTFNVQENDVAAWVTGNRSHWPSHCKRPDIHPQPSPAANQYRCSR